jgi:beta-ureidopropionase / N-carbamoyl-L-amino-acid hydrolase
MPSSTEYSGAVIAAAAAVAPVIDGERLWQRLMALAEIGRRGETGVDRAAFSPEDRAARRLLYGWARECGLEASQDSIGNLFLRYPGRSGELAPVLTGSHLDSQPSGGRFDGAYGVLASLEAVAALSRAGIRPARSIEVVAWSNEEGGRFAPGAMGSQIFGGARSLADVLTVRDAAGVVLSEALTETLAALPEAAPRVAGPAPSAYLEAHIEQGPRLDRAGIPVGVVVGIQGCLWLEYEVRGAAAHAGTTPHEYRRDALQAALALISRLREMCVKGSPSCRFTVGRMAVEPNTPNTIPGRVTFTIDFRDADPVAFAELGRELRAAAAPQPCELEVRELFTHAPEMFSKHLVDVVATATRAHNYPEFELVSGAFHDALFVAKVCPVGMVFVRCRDGVSHNPVEYAAPSDVTAGAQVLMSALLQLAAE